MAIRLIATDLDGTLLKSDHQPPEEFFDWVKRHEEIMTVIASGRSYPTLRKMFESIEDQLIFCGDNGGFIFHKGEKIYSNPIKKGDLYHAVRFMGNIPDTALVLCGEKSGYVLRQKPESMEHIGMFFENLTVVDDLNSVIGKDEIVKMSIFEENGDAAGLAEYLPSLGKHMELVLSEKYWIDIQNITTNKGNALKFLQGKYGISPEECMAFGDYLNDYSMMKACHYSFAMANAHPKLKEIASFETTTNDYLGVMNMLSVMTE